VGVPTVEHFIFIPVVMLFGMIIGYLFGLRAARSQLEQKRNRARE
jgi:uncharacterized protein YneF (UPF0154 family)